MFTLMLIFIEGVSPVIEFVYLVVLVGIALAGRQAVVSLSGGTLYCKCVSSTALFGSCLGKASGSVYTDELLRPYDLLMDRSDMNFGGGTDLKA